MPAMRSIRRFLPLLLLLLSAAAIPLFTAGLEAVPRSLVREARVSYERKTWRLRVDLRAATHADDPNVISLAGIGYPREDAEILFTELESVYLDRITREGRSRLNLTIYRSLEEAERMRASAVPPPPGIHPTYSGTLAIFARQGSTTVILELQAKKEEPDKQRDEVTILLDRLFYISDAPTIEILEDYVRRHPWLPSGRLRAVTGLDIERIRAILLDVSGGSAGGR